MEDFSASYPSPHGLHAINLWGPIYSEYVRRWSSHGKTPSGHGCQADRSTLKPSSLPSVKVDYWKIAVGQGLNVPPPSIFAMP